MCRSDSLERQPCAIRSDSPLASNGIPETECVYARRKLDRSPDNELRKEQNHQPGKIDIAHHEAHCEPGSSERLNREKRGKPVHRKIYEPIERAEYFSKTELLSAACNHRMNATATINWNNGK
jgi:hypothetical protein